MAHFHSAVLSCFCAVLGTTDFQECFYKTQDLLYSDQGYKCQQRLILTETTVKRNWEKSLVKKP